MKACTKCGETKDLDAFVKSKTTKSGYRGCCKTCFNTYYAQRRIDKYEQVREYERKFHKERRLKYEYQTTQEHIDSLYVSQNGKCAICQSEGKLVIDHCHNNGQVRGLLCPKCNLGLGHFRDNTSFLNNAIKYLKEHND